MSDRSFSGLIWESIIESWGPILAVLSFISGIAAFFVVPATDVITTRVVMVIVFTFIFICWVFSRAAWLAHKNRIIQLPRVRYVRNAPKAYDIAFALFLVDNTPLLSHDSLVSIYYLEDELERLVGLGKVINIQNDLKIQVLVIADFEFGDKLDLIKKNSSEELKRLVIKPSIPGFVLENIRNG